MGFGAGTRCKDPVNGNAVFHHILTLIQTSACIGINLAHTELRLGISNFFRKFPTAVVSTNEGMSDLDMRQRAWVFMTPVGHKCLIGVQ